MSKPSAESIRPIQATTDTTLERFLYIDEQLSKHKERNQLQDRLLSAYAEACGIEAGG